jgi:hypothetical protein
MKRYSLLVWRQKPVVVFGLAALGLAMPMSTSFAASATFCQSYARDYALRYAAKLPVSTSRTFLRSQLYEHALDRCMTDQFP